MNRDPRWLRLLDGAYGVALHLYPRGFRARWGGHMRQAFRDRCREIARGERMSMPLVAELMSDLAFSAGRERLHAMEGIPMSKRNWMFGLLLVFGAMLAMHDRIGTAGMAVVDAWKHRQATLDDVAMKRFYRDAGNALERAATGSRDHAIAALLHARAGEPAADREWQAAVDAKDPLALWISAVSCPVTSCDRRRAIEELAKLEPGNAAVAHVQFDLASRAGDAAGMRAALVRIAESSYYEGRDSDLANGLLAATGQTPVPRRLLQFGGDDDAVMAMRTVLAAGIWMTIDQPGYVALSHMCRRDTAAAIVRDCIAVARNLADGNTLIARSVGSKIWRRLVDTAAERAIVEQRMREDRWLIANLSNVVDFDTTEGLLRWRRARLRSASELESYRLLEREGGIPQVPPTSFRLEPSALGGDGG